LRTFIAVTPPDAIRRLVGRHQAQLDAEGVVVRWVKPSNVHLTLKFLGDTDPAREDDIRRAMRAAAAGQAPFELALGGLGGFPNLSRPRVLWLGVTGALADLQTVQGCLERHLTAAGHPAETRPFRAHMTIGRLRHPRRWRSGMTAIIKRMADRPPQRFTVDCLVWYRSRLRPGGAEYTALARVPLTGPGPGPAP
jgi:2'-5' RNA ligase